jgi:hypothetical protein
MVSVSDTQSRFGVVVGAFSLRIRDEQVDAQDRQQALINRNRPARRATRP